jgi:hypothetical protein
MSSARIFLAFLLLLLPLLALAAGQGASVPAAQPAGRAGASAPAAQPQPRSDRYALRPADDPQSRSSFGLKLHPAGQGLSDPYAPAR